MRQVSPRCLFQNTANSDTKTQPLSRGQDCSHSISQVVGKPEVVLRSIADQAAPLGQIPQKFPCLIVEAGKDCRQVLVAHVSRDGFTYHLAEVGGQRQVAAFVELRLVEAGPAAIDAAS